MPCPVWRRDYFPCIPARYVLAVASFLGFASVNIARVNLSVAIVEMVSSTATAVENGSTRALPMFDWSASEQGQVLGAFFYGYVALQIPGGMLAQKIGSRWVIGIGVGMLGVLTLLTPLAANVSGWLVVVVRALEGAFVGVSIPATHVLWSKWAPPDEKSFLSMISYSGLFFGTIVSLILSGILTQYGGWSLAFYVPGLFCLLWCLLWIMVGYSQPSSHPRISKKERRYIESSTRENKAAPIPWLRIFLSPAVWAIIIAHFCQNWGFYIFFNLGPTYMKQTLPELAQDKSIIENGVYSAIPYVPMTITTFSSGILAGLMSKYCCSTTTVRKIMTTISNLSGAILLPLCGYFGTTALLTLTFLILVIGFQGFAMAGFFINHLDIAPQYSGLLMGITSTIGNLPGFFATVVAKAMTPEPPFPKGSSKYYDTFRDEWLNVFLVTAEVYAVGMIVYTLFASGTKQDWAEEEEPDQ